MDTSLKYVLFGTGKGGKRVYNLIKESSQITIECFLDNYPKGDKYMGLPVIQADIYLQNHTLNNIVFIIASVYKDDIIKQLKSYGIENEKIWTNLNVVMNNWNRYKARVDSFEKGEDGKSLSIVFDCGAGFVLGGVEKWTYELIRMLKKKMDIPYIMLSKDDFTEAPEDLKEHAYHIEGVESFFDFDIHAVNKIIKKLTQCMPCVVFTAHVDNLLIAAAIVKEKYTEQITIVSTVHGGLYRILEENVAISSMVDYILCVSPDSCRILQEKYGLSNEKILFKETPVQIKNINRKYTLNIKAPIKIAYAARLEKIHKHSELLIPLIKHLEDKSINYELDIAGEGPLYNQLDEFIKESKISDHVRLLGRVKYEEMETFWLKHDIAINMSECEGCSLAMLESMSFGDVPIFTNVFSSKHFIRDGYNGYVVDYGNIGQMVNHIQYLSQNRKEIKIMGLEAYEKVKDLCDMNDYVDYIMERIICNK